MKKRFLLLVVLVFCSFCLLCSCGSGKASGTDSLESVLEGTGLILIPGEENLAYYEKGNTVYIVFNYVDVHYSQSYGGIAPLIIHGHYCEYIDGEIVEVIE